MGCGGGGGGGGGGGRSFAHEFCFWECEIWEKEIMASLSQTAPPY